MYRITARTYGKETIIYEPRDEELQVISPELREEVGKNGILTFTMLPTHPYIDSIVPLASEFIVWKDKEIIFTGRMIGRSDDFYKTGRVECEGALAYLLDSIQMPYAFQGTAAEYFSYMLESHNNQVEERKRFEPGNITVGDPWEVTRGNTECSNTLEEMLSQLVNLGGGYLRVRYSGGKRYLDYVHDYGGINSQVIRYGENLLDLDKSIDPTGIVTMLIPLGATIEDDDPEKEPTVVDITSVNGGKNYISNQAAIDRYGQIWGSVKFDDVTDPEALLAKAKAYLEESVLMPETIELSALDLNLIEADAGSLNVGCWTEMVSVPHGIKKRFMMSSKITDLSESGRDSITLGQTVKTFTGESAKQAAEVSARINRVASNASKEINRKVENATQLITGGKGGYVVLDVRDPDTGEKMHPWRMLFMDTPDKETARSVIQINKNGIGFSTTGILGPYRNAWTIDGNLVADFITTGTMLADRVRGGTYEVGGIGLGRDGSIIVKDLNDNIIGSWDKTGLTILKGLLQGVSAIFGGLNNQDGAIEVRDASGRTIGRWDKDGLFISRGDISVGPFSATEDGVVFGDWEVSADGSNILRSIDGSVTIQNEQGGPLGSYAALRIGDSEIAEEGITTGGVITESIVGTAALTEWNGERSRHYTGWSIFDALDDLRDRVDDIDVGV